MKLVRNLKLSLGVLAVASLAACGATITTNYTFP